VDLAWEVIINNIQIVNVWPTSWQRHLEHPPLDKQISWSLIFIVIIVFIIEIIESTWKNITTFPRQITFFYDHLKSSNHYWKNYGSDLKMASCVQKWKWKEKEFGVLEWKWKKKPKCARLKNKKRETLVCYNENWSRETLIWALFYIVLMSL
jgi:hypothetical protein